MCGISGAHCSVGMFAEDANGRSTNHTPRRAALAAQFGLMGCVMLLDLPGLLLSHLHLLFFLVLNKSPIKKEHLQIFSICIEEAKQRASVGSS